MLKSLHLCGADPGKLETAKLPGGLQGGFGSHRRGLLSAAAAEERPPGNPEDSMQPYRQVEEGNPEREGSPQQHCHSTATAAAAATAPAARA